MAAATRRRTIHVHEAEVSTEADSFWDYAEALASPHVVQTGLVHDMALPGGQTVPTVGNPVRMTGYEFDVFRRPPPQASGRPRPRSKPSSTCIVTA